MDVHTLRIAGPRIHQHVPKMRISGQLDSADLEAPMHIMRAGYSHSIALLEDRGGFTGGCRGCRRCSAILKIKKLQLTDDGVHLPKQFPAADLGGVSRLHGGQFQSENSQDQVSGLGREDRLECRVEVNPSAEGAHTEVTPAFHSVLPSHPAITRLDSPASWHSEWHLSQGPASVASPRTHVVCPITNCRWGKQREAMTGSKKDSRKTNFLKVASRRSTEDKAKQSMVEWS
jgi:hypothetical protein